MINLTGAWYTDSGSKLDLRLLPDGQIEGTFHTCVGKAPGIFRVVGLADLGQHEGSQSFGMTVVWNNDQMNLHSATVWSGQYQVNNGEEVLMTTWLLTQETCPDDDWASTLVGTDKFQRTQPDSISDATHRPVSYPMR